MIVREGALSTTTVTTKPVAAVRVASVSATAESSNHEDVGPVIQSLFGIVRDAKGRSSRLFRAVRPG
jgi:hypothetical protein